MLRWVLVLVLLSVVIPAKSQIIAGIKGGLNVSSQRYNIDGQQSTNTSAAKIAFHLGALYEYEISEKNGIQPELFYSLEGARSDEDGGSMNLSYLKLPVLWYFIVSDGFRLLIGPEFAYLLNARANSHGFGADRRDAYENFIFNVSGGAEYNINGGWRLGVRYSRGLSNFLNRDFYTFDLRSKTDTFQFYTAFVFQIY